jgi:acetoin utilization protein AcuC
MAAYARPDDPDPLFYLHMADTLNFQISLLLLVVNDPESPRFNVDVDENGRPTRFGTLRRNIPEELRAMEYGLAPGQVRAGLRLSHKAVPTLERFISRTGHDLVIIDPLYYHNAVVYEKYGFAYFQGRRRMEWINEGLRPGGEFFERLDGSTPFRPPDAWKSIRGRSWAIHDGVLGEPFGEIHMYKRVGHQAGVNTFPDGVW